MSLDSTTNSMLERVAWMRWAKLVLVIVVVMFVYNQVYSKTVRAVTAVGVGTKKVSAEKATMTFTIVAEGVDQNSAVTNGEAKFNDVLSGVTSTFNPTEVNKASYQVLPKASTGSGYQYVSGAQITFQGAEKVPSLSQFLNQKGATVAQVRYLPADEKAADKEIRNLAVKDAHDKAQEMANAAGAGLGKVLSVTEQGSTGQTGTSVSSAQTAQNSSSQIELQSVVNVTFELRNRFWLF